MMQSRAGIASEDYAAQKALLGKLEKGELTRDDLLERGAALINEEIAAAKA
jgi:pyruvate-ferredoxin/flavodoxin oxidoreductase